MPASRAVPAPVFVLGGIVSLQLGAGVAKGLFEEVAPAAIVFLRLLTAAVVVLVVVRSTIGAVWRGASRHDLLIAAAFGVALAVMNFSIYQSFARIPLGIAVTIEFLGPLGVAVAYSRRRLDLAWVALAGGGVVLLMRGDASGLDPVGVAFALVAAGCWAAYIVLSAETGRRFDGATGLAIASAVGMVLIAPVGITAGSPEMWEPRLLLIGIAVGLLSSALPYSLELEALRRLPQKTFGIFMSAEPVVAAVVGLIVLGEVLLAREWVAVGCVVLACTGAMWASARAPMVPES